MNLRGENLKMVGKLAVVTAGMFCFGYALVPIYKAICEITGINILSISASIKKEDYLGWSRSFALRCCKALQLPEWDS